MNDEIRTNLIEESKAHAVAFHEDFHEINRVISDEKNISKSSIRQLSNILRRLLIDNDGDLRRISPPRIGRLLIQAPNFDFYYRRFEQNSGVIFVGSEGRIGPKKFGCFSGWSGQMDVPAPKTLDFINLTQDEFLSQRTIHFQGRWITRREVIKYVANVSSGVHTREPKSGFEQTLFALGKFMRINIGRSEFITDTSGIFGFNSGMEFSYDPRSLDPSFFEMLNTAYYLVKSDDIKKLNSIVFKEIG